MSLEIIFHYFSGLSGEQRRQFGQLYPLYKGWNEKINVISRKDIDNLYVHHVLHSLGIAKVISFTEGTEVLDVGTGGGFPGIPLAILFPNVNFHLVDSIGKKIKVVNAVSKELGLTNVSAHQVRAEEIKSTYDFVVSRAVTNLGEFYSWTNRKIKRQSINAMPNGILYLKGGELEDELAGIVQPAQVFHLSDYFIEEFFLTKKVVYIPVETKN